MTDEIFGDSTNVYSNKGAVTAIDKEKTAPFVMGWTRFTNCQICAALSGTATSVTASVERSATNPQTGPSYVSPADSTGFTGNLTTGIAPNLYQETGVGWWRINVTAVSGGNVTASLAAANGGN